MRDARETRSEARPGDHIVLVYEDRAELYAFIVPFVKNGVERGERCIYIPAESKPADVAAALSAGGVRVDRETNRGAFEFMTPREYYRFPPLESVRAVQHLNELLADARSAGFTGLRVAGERRWAGKMGLPGDILGDYEALLDKVLGPQGATVACIYRKDRFDPDMLQRHVRTHGKVIAKDYVFLSLSELFRDLAATDLQGLAQTARERTVRKGDVFFRQGDPGSDVYLLTAGLVKLVRTDAEGRAVILRVVSPTEPFGERALTHANAVRLATAEAMEDSRALVWNSAAVVRMLVTHPAVSLSALRLLEDRVERERLRLEDFASPDVRRRLGRLLLRLGDYAGRKTRRGIVVQMPLSRRDLAEMTATSPYTASRILAEWRRQDILDAQRTRIIIHDRDRLAVVAGERAGSAAPKSAVAKMP